MNSYKNRSLKKKLMILPAATQHPEDVLLWSYFGRYVQDHNRIKIGRVRFLTYLGSAMSDINLASGNTEKFS